MNMKARQDQQRWKTRGDVIDYEFNIKTLTQEKVLDYTQVSNVKATKNNFWFFQIVFMF